jgi:hypothetical protein
MRSATCLLWMSAFAAWGVEALSSGGILSIEGARAGQSVRYNLTGERDGSFKVNFTVRKPDGTSTALPPQVVEAPFPTPPSNIEGPTIPGDCGGGVLVVEVFDPDTGQKLHKSAEPIGF